MLLRIVKSEGFAGVFKGFSANMINTFSQRMSSFLHLIYIFDWNYGVMMEERADD